MGSASRHDHAGQQKCLDAVARTLARKLPRGRVIRLLGAAGLSSVLGRCAVPDVRPAFARKRKKKRRKNPRLRLPPSPPPPPPLPGTPPLTAIERRLLSRGGVWAEIDWDGDTVCYWYHFTIGSLGERRLNRTHFFVDIIGQCRWSTPAPPTGIGTWSQTGNTLTIQFASGVVERLVLGTYVASADAQPIIRNGVQSYWHGCAASYNPFYCP
jgi:hypothetical protein